MARLEKGGGMAPVKILYIIDSLWGVGGAELSLKRLVQHLPTHRFESRVITFYTADTPSARRLRGQFACPVEHWPIHGLYHPEAWKTAARLYRLIRKERIEIVHTFFPVADLWAGVIARLAGARVLVSSRRDMGFTRQPWHRAAYRVLQGIYDRVLTVSDEVRRFTIDTDGISPDRILTVPNGIEVPELERAAPDTESFKWAVPDGAPLVVTLANSRRVKGLDVLVRAAALVHRERPDVHFAVAGGSGGRPDDRAFTAETRGLVSAFGLQEHVHFVGLTERPLEFLRRGDVFVLPSRSEGMSNALLEAMSLGMPCVATAVGGNPEVVVEGKTGFLVPPNAPEPLAHRMLTLLEDSALRARMGQAGRQRVCEQYTSSRMADRVIETYEHLLAGAN